MTMRSLMNRHGHLLLWGGIAILAACGDDAATPEPTTDTGTDAGSDVTDEPAEDTGGDVLDAADGREEPDASDLADGSDLETDSADMGPTDVIEEPVPDPEPDGPPGLLLTVNEIPAEMNGSVPYNHRDTGPSEFTLLLPTHGFTIDLMLDREARFIDPDLTELMCDQAVGIGDDTVDADDRLAGELVARDTHLRWLVPQELSFPEGRATCQARVTNFDGEESEWSSVTFDTTPMTEALHPFDPAEVALVTFTRDNYDIAVEGDFFTPVLTVVDGADGEEDFVEDLRLIGFQGDESGEGAATFEGRGVVGMNAYMREWVIAETMAQVRELFSLDPETGEPFNADSVLLSIYWDGDQDAPDYASGWDGTYTVHGVGGDHTSDWPNTFGLASAIDINNTEFQDNGEMPYGAFTTHLARVFIENGAARAILRSFLPISGVPMGEGDYDVQILAEDFDPFSVPPEIRRRRNDLHQQIELYTKGVASLIAHELGHTFGLVASGPPPTGLFGGIYDDDWMLSPMDGSHIDVEGMNVMQSGGSIFAQPEAIFGEVSFNALNLAYLRGRLIVRRP